MPFAATPSASAAPGGLRRRGSDLLALLSGGLVTLSLAPFELWPLGILACLGLLQALPDHAPGAAARRGWLFGLGMFGSGTSWVYVSIHVHGNAPVPLALLLVMLFSAGLALLPAAMAWLLCRVAPATGSGRMLAFPALWLLFEWLRGWLLTGFPWLYLGYGHLDSPLAGWLPVAGTLGVSLMVAFSAAVLDALLRRQRPWPAVAAAVAVWAAGPLLATVEWVRPVPGKLSLALVQPDIPQQLKWDEEYFHSITGTLRAMTADAADVDLVVWPEAAIPRVYQAAAPLVDEIEAGARVSGQALLTGIPYRRVENDGHYRYYNSVLLLAGERQFYHKQHLVPFGEYVPLERWLRGLIEFFDLPMSDFSGGPAGQPPLQLDDWRIAPLVCYEIAYGELTRRAAQQADVLLTVSNDSWFGRSLGPQQHFQIARVRALENGRALVRGTNNGISAVVDHRGRVTATGPQYQPTVVRGEAGRVTGQTPYNRLGDWPALIVALLALGVAVTRQKPVAPSPGQ